MSSFETLLLLALLVVLLVFRPSLRVSLVMLANYVFTIVLHNMIYWVAAADLVAACALIGWRRKVSHVEGIVAFLFFVAAMVYPLTSNFDLNTTYAIIEGIGYIQLGVIGGLDTWIYRASRHFAGRLRGGVDLPATRVDAESLVDENQRVVESKGVSHVNRG